jgi:hypothetical protein
VLYEITDSDEAALDRWDGATLGYYDVVRNLTIMDEA